MGLFDGGQASSTTSSTVAPWAQPYIGSLLERGAALANRPYVSYDQPRIAGFSPLQMQAQQAAAGMQVSPQTQLASSFAEQLAQRGTGLGGTYSPLYAPTLYTQAPQLQQYQMGPAQQVGTQDFTGQNVGQYMSPYMQNVVDIQQREAQRQADIAATQRGAQAARSGAFGGSRAGLLEAEAARNLAIQKGDIQAQGQQAAFQNAQQQFNAQQQRDLQAQLANQQAGLTTGAQNLGALLGVQQLGAGQSLQSQQANQAAQQAANQLAANQQQFGAGLGLQGLNLGMQGANLLGTLGQNQYTQNMGINALQQQTGATQQALRQQGLTQAYQDFLNQRAYPQQQLGLLQSLMTGAPLGTQTTQTMTPASPSGIQSLGALGMGAYGLSQLFPGLGTGISSLFGFKDGGAVQNYAKGGITGPDNEARIVSKLSDPQLQQSMQLAQARNDVQQIDAIQDELAMRASERGGLAGLYNRLAGGGIVSFQAGGLNPMTAPAVLGLNQEDSTETEEEDEEDILARAIQSGSTPEAYRAALLQSIRQASQQEPYTPRTADERKADIEQYYTQLQGMFGDNKAKEFLEKNIKESDADRATAMREGKGLAALAAMEGLVSSPNWIQGLGAAGGRFAGVYGDVLKQDKAEKRALASMQFNLMDAERKERMGLTRDAIALNQEAEKDYRAARKAHSDKRFALVNALSRAAPAFKQPTPPKPPKPTQPNAANTMLADLKAGIREEHPEWSDAKVNKEAAEKMLTMKSGLPAANVRAETATQGLEAKRLLAAEASLTKFKTLSPTKWNDMVSKYGSETAAKKAYMDQFAKIHNATIGEDYDVKNAPALNLSAPPTASRVPALPPGFAPVPTRP